MRFLFGGAEYEGREGETLAAALVRNGVLGGFRSLYRGRPRGVYTAGEEEPNALVQIGLQPLQRATLVQLEEGLVAEPVAGKGRLREPDAARYDAVHAHCDLLVVGAGRAGRTVARPAQGRVLLVDGLLEDEEVTLGRTWVVGLYPGNYALAVERSRRLSRARLPATETPRG
jgi:sarcosine oxidase, subunit alpha